MSNITAGSIHLFVGRMVRVVYVAAEAVKAHASGPAVVVDSQITLSVCLERCDPTAQTATFRRRGAQFPIVEEKVLSTVHGALTHPSQALAIRGPD